MSQKVRRLSVSDAAYIAGLVDGEGTIALTRKHARDNRQLVISISSTERPILDFVQTSLGVGKITRKRTSRAHHRPGLTYTVANRQALALLEQIHPYLHSYKYARGALVLTNYLALTPRNGKYNEATRSARTAFEDAFLSITTRVRPANDKTAQTGR